MEPVDIQAIAQDYNLFTAFMGSTHTVSQEEFNQLPQYQREDMVRHKLTVQGGK